MKRTVRDFAKVENCAAEALGCDVSELQQGHSWGGTVYDDGSEDTMHRFFQRGTNRSVVIYWYADGDMAAGMVDECNEQYPRTVSAKDVVNSIFSTGLFMLPGGRARYDEVYSRDGSHAIYLARIEVGQTIADRLHIVRRRIDWETKIIQLFEVVE